MENEKMENREWQIETGPQAAPPTFKEPASIFLAFCFAILLYTSCSNPNKSVSPAFYHWQTQLQLTTAEEKYMEQMSTKALYIKFFDVDWDEDQSQAVPLATLRVAGRPADSLQIIPTVFITNRTFSHLSGAEIDTLAQRMYDKIFQLATNFPKHLIREIQIDCDWSQTTRAGYFQLLQGLHTKLQAQEILLSVTIRLHQVRYREQTGIPPADRGMVMCYNTGEVEDWAEENSILRLETAGPYLDRLKSYPLPLDLALPIFHWGVLFRNGEMIRLINGLTANHLRDTTRFSAMTEQRYEVIKSTFLQGYYLYRGDRLRLESVSLQELQEMAALLNDRWPTTDFRLAFYHLDTTTIQHYPYLQLDSLRLLLQ